MEANAVARVIKAAAALLAVAGVVVTPEIQEEIAGGFFAIYAVASLVQAKLGK